MLVLTWESINGDAYVLSSCCISKLSRKDILDCLQTGQDYLSTKVDPASFPDLNITTKLLDYSVFDQEGYTFTNVSSGHHTHVYMTDEYPDHNSKYQP